MEERKKGFLEKITEEYQAKAERTINWIEELRSKSDDELKRIAKDDGFFSNRDKVRAAKFILDKRS